MNTTTFPKTIGYVSDNKPLFQYEDNLFHIAEPVTIEQLCYAMSLLLDKQFNRDNILTSLENTKHYLLSKLSGLEQEVFSCVHLDNKHRVMDGHEYIPLQVQNRIFNMVQTNVKPSNK